MAKMIRCKTCGNSIAKSAKICPHCGAKCNVKVPLVVRLLVGVFALIVLLNVFAESGEDGNKNESSSNSTHQQSESDNPKIDSSKESSQQPSLDETEKSDASENSVGFGGTISSDFFDITLENAKLAESIESPLGTIAPQNEASNLLFLVFSAKNKTEETYNLGSLNAYADKQSVLPTSVVGQIDGAMPFVGAVASGMEMKAYFVLELSENWEELQLNYFEATGPECKQYFVIHAEDIN